jgi:Domain of unknown function (DUF4334)/GXWXG protein
MAETPYPHRGKNLRPAAVPPGITRLEQLRTLENGASTDEALAFFDALPPITVTEMFGSWRGSGLQTGHPLDGLLELFGWHGKRFEGPEGVHPLVFDGPNGSVFSITPSLIPLGFAVRHPKAVRHPIVSGLCRLFRFALRTKKPCARLRMTEYRGVVSATMIYDTQPINDVFRKVDDNTLLGAMDFRLIRQPFFFVLRREA